MILLEKSREKKVIVHVFKQLKVPATVRIVAGAATVLANPDDMTFTQGDNILILYHNYKDQRIIVLRKCCYTAFPYSVAETIRTDND